MTPDDLLSVWTDLGFRGNLYEIDPVPPTEEGERLLVGRAAELEQLRLYLTSSSTHPTIEGQNGVGKSSLVAVAGFQLKRAFQREATTQLLIPLRERFQLDGAATADAFARQVYFAVAQAFIDNHDLLKKTQRKVPDIEHIRDWLNSPIFVSRQGGVQVLGSGSTYGQGSGANEGAGFSEAGFRATVERWLSEMFPSDERAGSSASSTTSNFSSRCRGHARCWKACGTRFSAGQVCDGSSAAQEGSCEGRRRRRVSRGF